MEPDELVLKEINNQDILQKEVGKEMWLARYQGLFENYT